jgi:hypothetical protein
MYPEDPLWEEITTEKEDNQMSEGVVFKALTYRILESPRFAAAVLGEDADARKEVLIGFLQESDVPEESWDDALASVNEALEGVDLEGIARVHVALDNLEPMAPL